MLTKYKYCFEIHFFSEEYKGYLDPDGYIIYNGNSYDTIVKCISAIKNVTSSKTIDSVVFFESADPRRRIRYGFLKSFLSKTGSERIKEICNVLDDLLSKFDVESDNEDNKETCVSEENEVDSALSQIAKYLDNNLDNMDDKQKLSLILKLTKLNHRLSTE